MLAETDYNNYHFQSMEESILVPELILTAPTPEMDGFAAEGLHSARKGTFSYANLDLSKQQVHPTSEPSTGPLDNILERTIPDLNLKVSSRPSRKSFPDYSGKVLRDNPRLSLTPRAPSGATAIRRRVRDKTEGETLASSAYARNRYAGVLKPISNSWLWKRLSTAKTSLSKGSRTACTVATATDHLVEQNGPTLLPSSQWSRRHSDSPMEARVIEEGEHAASRLFGTPNTGTKKEKSGGRSDDRRNSTEPKVVKQPRRHSLGFDLWASRRQPQGNK